MKRKSLKTLWMAAIFFSAVRINSQTAGTTSLTAIEITDSIAQLIGQSPGGKMKWYKIESSNPSVFVKTKLKTLTPESSLIFSEVYIMDSLNNVIRNYSDSLRIDSSTVFALEGINPGQNIYVVHHFTDLCTDCISFDFFVYKAQLVSCPPASAGCNLVRNPSFENYTIPCANMGIGIFPVCDWSKPLGCTTPTVGTPDYYNTCWNQYTGGHTGNAGIGMYLYGYNNYNAGNGSYREYINSQLLSATVPGKTYQISLWAADRYSTTHVMNLSLFFSSSYPCQDASYNNINLNLLSGQKVDVISTSNNTSSGWQNYIVNFVANGTYDKITVGNFFDNSAINWQTPPLQAYYFIDDISILTPTVSISSPVVLSCSANYFQFNPSVCQMANTTYAYSWSPSTGLSNPNILNPMVTINTSMTYTLTQTGTNASGTIVNTATVAVVLPGYAVLNTGGSFQNICTNQYHTSTTITAATSGFTGYLWQPGNLSGATLTVSPSVSTVYTVTGSFFNCVSTATVQVYVSNSCCDGSNTPNFNGANVASNVAYTSPLIFNNDITVLPGGQLTLANAEYLFAPNVKITVAPNAQLTIRDAHLYACGAAMWKGVVVQSGGKVICTTGISKDNLIEDAITAIDAGNQTNNNLSSILNITNTTFNKNYVDINISNYNNATTNYPFTFSKCVFTCRNLPFSSTAWPKVGTTNNATTNLADLRFATASTAGLAAPFLGQGFAITNLKSPYSGQCSQVAIQLTNVGLQSASNISYGITIGDASQTLNYNLFDAHNNFIYAIDCNVNSFNNTFQNTKLVTGSASGSAIKTINNYTNTSIINSKLDLVSPTSPNLNFNRFYDCHTGIEARNQSTLNVKYARISSTQSVLNPTLATNPGNFGIFIESNRFNNYLVLNSQFLNVNTGIYCSATTNYLNATTYGQSWGTFSVTANLFCPASTTATAVGNGFVNTGIIVENILAARTSAAPSFYAFLPNNGLRLEYNNFYKVWNGIYVNSFYTNGFAKYIDNNIVNLVQQGSGNINQRGINSTYNNQSSVRTNTVTGFSINTAFVTSGVYSSLNSNSDVQCNLVSTLPRGFEFAGANSVMAWRGNTMANNGRGMQGTNWGTSPSSGGIGAQGAGNSPSDNFWQGTWNGSANLQTYTDANTNAANSKIYARSGNGYVLNQAWNNGQNTGNSYFVSTNRPSASSSTYVTCGTPAPRDGMEWHDIADEDSDDESAEINQYLLFINLDMDSLLLVNDDTLESFYDVNVPEEVGQLNEIEKALALGLYEDAGVMISSFNPETNIQSNFKKFFSLYLTYRTTDTLRTSDSTDLFVLTNQCPFKDGPAIYKARALYNLIYATVIDYNDEGCEEDGYSGRMAHTQDTSETKSVNDLLAANESKNIIKKTKTDYKIYPNPTVDAIYIKSKKENEEIHVIISDLSGRQMLDKYIFVNASQPGLQLNLVNGVYTITLINSKNERIIKKLIISK